MTKFKCIEEKSGIVLEVYSERCDKEYDGNFLFYNEFGFILSIPNFFSIYKQNEDGSYKVIYKSINYSTKTVFKKEKQNIILESKQEVKKTKNKIIQKIDFFDENFGFEKWRGAEIIEKPPIKHKGIIDSLLEEIRINCELGNLQKVLILSKELKEENKRLYIKALFTMA